MARFCQVTTNGKPIVVNCDKVRFFYPEDLNQLTRTTLVFEDGAEMVIDVAFDVFVDELRKNA